MSAFQDVSKLQLQYCSIHKVNANSPLQFQKKEKRKKKKEKVNANSPVSKRKEVKRKKLGGQTSLICNLDMLGKYFKFAICICWENIFTKQTQVEFL